MENEKNLILKYADKTEEYLEGDEVKLLRIFKSDKPALEVEKVLADKPSWSMIYHLSEQRENLLSWYPFSKEETLLEVGSGCGAITGLFCEKLKKVTAVELTERRAKITALRHERYKNLTVYAGNIDKIPLEEKYDYVTSIGVLEYAGKYSKSESPFIDFLKKLKSFLKEQGILILAIENKFGLKYWSGAPEDHTGKVFNSLEGYPSSDEARTFSKKELEELLILTGFNSIQFYYPSPDYKFPAEIFSDEYLPNKIQGLRAGLTPHGFTENKIPLFNDDLVSDGVITAGQFPFFSNSFLVFAKGE